MKIGASGTIYSFAQLIWVVVDAIMCIEFWDLPFGLRYPGERDFCILYWKWSLLVEQLMKNQEDGAHHFFNMIIIPVLLKYD